MNQSNCGLLTSHLHRLPQSRSTSRFSTEPWRNSLNLLRAIAEKLRPAPPDLKLKLKLSLSLRLKQERFAALLSSSYRTSFGSSRIDLLGWAPESHDIEGLYGETRYLPPPYPSRAAAQGCRRFH